MHSVTNELMFVRFRTLGHTLCGPVLNSHTHTHIRYLVPRKQAAMKQARKNLLVCVCRVDIVVTMSLHCRIDYCAVPGDGPVALLSWARTDDRTSACGSFVKSPLDLGPAHVDLPRWSLPRHSIMNYAPRIKNSVLLSHRTVPNEAGELLCTYYYCLRYSLRPLHLGRAGSNGRRP